MPNLVTQRFIECHNLLKENKVIASSRQFAFQIDTSPQSLNQVLKGKRDVTVNNIMKIVEEYNVSSKYLMTGEGPMFNSEDKSEEPINKILYVPMDAHAGYLDQHRESITTQEDFQAFSIPGYMPSYGEHRCFDVAGDSMEPTLFCGDKIICSLISRDNYYNSLRDNYVYVVITTNDIVVKRIKNRIKQDGKLYLKSDNEFYGPVSVDANDIKEIWEVKLKISPFMSNPSNIRNAFHTEIDELKETIALQSQNIVTMNQSLENLLRSRR